MSDCHWHQQLATLLYCKMEERYKEEEKKKKPTVDQVQGEPALLQSAPRTGLTGSTQSLQSYILLLVKLYKSMKLTNECGPCPVCQEQEDDDNQT